MAGSVCVNVSLNEEEDELLGRALEIERTRRVGQRLTRTSLARLLILERCAEIVQEIERQRAPSAG